MRHPAWSPNRIHIFFRRHLDHQTGLRIFFRRCPNHQTGHRGSRPCLDVRRGGTPTLEQSRSPAFPRKRCSGTVKATSTASRCPQFRTSHLASSCLGRPQTLQLPRGQLASSLSLAEAAASIIFVATKKIVTRNACYLKRKEEQEHKNTNQQLTDCWGMRFRSGRP